MSYQIRPGGGFPKWEKPVPSAVDQLRAKEEADRRGDAKDLSHLMAQKDAVQQLSGLSYEDALAGAVLTASQIRNQFTVKDSGEREERGNGFVRDTEKGKADLVPLFTAPWLDELPVQWVSDLWDHLKSRGVADGLDRLRLIPPHWLASLVAHMDLGAQKYGDDNWQKAQDPSDVERFRRSHARHSVQFQQEDDTEDHISAQFFNGMASRDVADKVERLARETKADNPWD